MAGAALGEFQVSLFVAGVALGEVGEFFFVTGAALGEVGESFFVAGATLGDFLNDSRGANDSMWQWHAVAIFSEVGP